MNKFLSLALLSILFLTSCSKDAVVSKNNVGNNSINSMFTQVCEEGKDVKGPWQGNLMLSSMNSAGMKQGDSEIFVEAGGVPTIIQDSKGSLISAFQWFDCDDAESFDKVAVQISDDDGVTWSDPESISVDGLPEGYQRPFDPTLVLTDDGQIRMYFTSSESGSMMLDKSTKIYSAISDDGVNYTFEEGVRFEVADAAAYDTAVGYLDGQWYLITPKSDSPKGAHFATSEDGLTFTTQDDILLDAEVNWTGNFVTMEDGLYFYGTASGKEGNWYSKTEDGKTWAEPVYLQSNFGGDPAVFCSDADDCLIISTFMAKLQNPN